jgi:mRNA interferase MazF
MEHRDRRRQGDLVSRKSAYVPERADLVWITLDPQAGHEQAGRRPAVVLSPSGYNKAAGLALFCPITSQAKGYPFEILIPPEAPVQGVVLTDQVRSLDWRVRRATRIGELPAETFTQVLQRVHVLLG